MYSSVFCHREETVQTARELKDHQTSNTSARWTDLPGKLPAAQHDSQMEAEQHFWSVWDQLQDRASAPPRFHITSAEQRFYKRSDWMILTPMQCFLGLCFFSEFRFSSRAGSEGSRESGLWDILWFHIDQRQDVQTKPCVVYRRLCECMLSGYKPCFCFSLRKTVCLHLSQEEMWSCYTFLSEDNVLIHSFWEKEFLNHIKPAAAKCWKRLKPKTSRIICESKK